MRVAVISDIHGNFIALSAVLEQIHDIGVERIICLGDVATLGPSPKEVIASLAAEGCVCIRGNHDEYMLNAEVVNGYAKSSAIVDTILATRESLSHDELSFIASFPDACELEIESTQLGLFHGSPRSNTEDLLATTSAESLDQALGDARCAVMIGGHTHIQMLRQHNGVMLVNPGSVGLPFEAYAEGRQPRVLPVAEFAIVETIERATSVRLCRTSLDRTKLHAAASAWDNPFRNSLMEQYCV